jgi:hypothetical protein
LDPRYKVLFHSCQRCMPGWKPNTSAKYAETTIQSYASIMPYSLPLEGRAGEGVAWARGISNLPLTVFTSAQHRRE